jgi:hypothetical protein
MDSGRAVGTDRGKEVLGLEPVNHLLQLLAISSEEDGSGPWAVTHAYYIAMDVLRTVVRLAEWLIVSAVACRLIGDGIFV